MSKYRLLVDWEVIEQLNAMPRPQRSALRDALRRIVESPDRYSDFRENSPRGWDIDVHLCHGFAIKYWSDFADRL